ncbi:hypothetical protein BaRGS_00011928 [Batillaria attramentaria]|uniref:Uncharacterized protein n=1 Tax=Batillaria attramentaria TaxID=370345 RepID=A0ABD0LCC6_9CAEN
MIVSPDSTEGGRRGNSKSKANRCKVVIAISTAYRFLTYIPHTNAGQPRKERTQRTTTMVKRDYTEFPQIGNCCDQRSTSLV